MKESCSTMQKWQFFYALKSINYLRSAVSYFIKFNSYNSGATQSQISFGALNSYTDKMSFHIKFQLLWPKITSGRFSALSFQLIRLYFVMWRLLTYQTPRSSSWSVRLLPLLFKVIIWWNLLFCRRFTQQ